MIPQGERGPRVSSSGTVTYYTTVQVLYLLSCLWKTIFKPLTHTSLEKYIEDTYNVVKLESPLNHGVFINVSEPVED